jgi:hypothetical protein
VARWPEQKKLNRIPPKTTPFPKPLQPGTRGRNKQDSGSGRSSHLISSRPVRRSRLLQMTSSTRCPSSCLPPNDNDGERMDIDRPCLASLACRCRAGASFDLPFRGVSPAQGTVKPHCPCSDFPQHGPAKFMLLGDKKPRDMIGHAESRIHTQNLLPHRKPPQYCDWPASSPPGREVEIILHASSPSILSRWRVSSGHPWLCDCQGSSLF